MNAPAGAAAPPRYSLRTLFLLTTLACGSLAVLVPLIRASHRAQVRFGCQCRMKEIALALANYHDTYRSFPNAITYADDGRPMHSWRVRIAPYLEQHAFYDRYVMRERWDEGANRLLGDEIPDDWTRPGGAPSIHVYVPAAFRCPAAPASQNPLLTNYVMVIDDRPGRPNGPPHLPGGAPQPGGPGAPILVVEIAQTDIHWMEPRDVLASELSRKINDRSAR